MDLRDSMSFAYLVAGLVLSETMYATITAAEDQAEDEVAEKAVAFCGQQRG
jgi:hypothetical protein